MKIDLWLATCFLFMRSITICGQGALGDIQVSLLTCSPGHTLYSTFGHSALRVTDPKGNMDEVFDFGVFNFDEPFFTWKFLRGSLRYHVASRSFSNFIDSYKMEGRRVIEQPLALSQNDTDILFAQLVENCRPENSYYLYRFLSNNCTTRIRDLLGVEARSVSTENDKGELTHRSCLNLYLQRRPWLKFGIDLLLGSPVDQKLSLEQQMFLPKLLSSSLANIHQDGAGSSNLSMHKILLEQEEIPNTKYALLKPFYVFLLLSIVWLMIWVWKPIFFTQSLFWIRIGLGLGGLFLLFMWFGSDHSSTKMNYNLLWLNPLYLMVVFFKLNRVKVLPLLLLVMFGGMILLFWNVLPQQLNVGLVPIIFIITMVNLVELVRWWSNAKLELPSAQDIVLPKS